MKRLDFGLGLEFQCLSLGFSLALEVVLSWRWPCLGPVTDYCSIRVFRADCMNATQIYAQLSPLNLLSPLKSSLKQIPLHETNVFSI